MGSYRRNVNSNHHYRDPGSIHKFSKQQFLQANCQFVVLDGHDYSIHKADPDWPVEWDCIEEIRFRQSASTETTCPICLNFPVAAKITRCGHIYCWTCMLQYLSLSEENCQQCPICFEPVYKSDLRSVVSHLFVNYSVGDEVVMRLMIRTKGCVEVEQYQPIADTNVEQAEKPVAADVEAVKNTDGHYWSQANLVIVDSDTVILKIAQRERDELKVKLELDKDEPEVCFIEQALCSLDKRVERLKSKTFTSNPNNNMNGSKSNARRANIDHRAATNFNPNNRMFSSPQQNHHIRGQHNLTSEPPKSYLFYQCSDGQHIYLNPFSTKILCQEYDNLYNCPLEIKAKILQMDWISMQCQWRKRFRYLEHLPLTCEFRLIEIDFDKSNLISSETYRTFESQIKKREQERQRRRKEERKREKIIQVEQNRRIYGIQPLLKINLDSTDQFPSVSDERYLGWSLPRNVGRSNDYEGFLTSDEDDNDDAVNNDIANQNSSSDNGNIATVGSTSNILGEVNPDVSTMEQIEGDNQIDVSGSSAITGVALSFRDIQLQEAAREAKAATTSQSNGKKSYGNSASGEGGGWSKGSTSGQQSSFAQLLVNAKTSQKQWTRNSGASNNSSMSSSTVQPQGAWPNRSSAVAKTTIASDSDDGGEELRRPMASGFTISDFIDMNTVSTSGGKKRGGKPKGAHHKKS